jgi:hypothetical protein
MPLSPSGCLFLAFALWPLPAFGQEGLSVDSSRAQIQTTLRSWYFNLAHRDWNAVTDDILAAKVVAHRVPPPPFRNLMVEPTATPTLRECTGGQIALVEAAVIRRDGDWAEVWVPRCEASFMEEDRFRLIHFQQRWRFVYIDLYEEQSPTHRNISDRR